MAKICRPNITLEILENLVGDITQWTQENHIGEETDFIEFPKQYNMKSGCVFQPIQIKFLRIELPEVIGVPCMIHWVPLHVLQLVGAIPKHCFYQVGTFPARS